MPEIRLMTKERAIKRRQDIFARDCGFSCNDTAFDLLKRVYAADLSAVSAPGSNKIRQMRQDKYFIILSKIYSPCPDNGKKPDFGKIFFDNVGAELLPSECFLSGNCG